MRKRALYSGEVLAQLFRLTIVQLGSVAKMSGSQKKFSCG